MSRIKKGVAVGLLCGFMLAAGAPSSLAAPGQAGDTGPRVNLNTASAEELVRLPGIGPALAEAIIKQRALEPFAKPEDVRKVKGVGDKLYDRIKDQVTVGDAPPSPKGRGS